MKTGGFAELIGLELLRITPGRFLMGSPAGDGEEKEHPEHHVEIRRGFALSMREVTRAQFRSVMGKDPSLTEGPTDEPVTNVSWLDAVTFCNVLSNREERPPYYRIVGNGDTTRRDDRWDERSWLPVADRGGVGVRMPGRELGAIPVRRG